MTARKRDRFGFPKHRSAKRHRSLDGVRLHIEPLEDRRVLAPMLEGITSNEGNLLDLESAETLQTSPSELTFVFGPGERMDPNSLSGIQLVRSGNDGVFGNDNDVDVAIGYAGIGESENKVVLRFAESLPDDNFEIRIGAPLRNLQNEPFGEPQTVPFNIDLGAKVIGVVPQPVVRNGSGELEQRRNQIVVYFNNDDLDTTSAQNPEFYQLIFTGHADDFDPSLDTVNNLDDSAPILPTSVNYSASSDSAVLTFAADIEDLTPGAGTYRLRIGTNEPAPLPPLVRNLDDDPDNPLPGQTIEFANNALGTLTEQSQVVSEFISTFDFEEGVFIVPPGGENDPGHRLAFGSDLHVQGGPDADEDVPVIAYNFDEMYGPNDLNVNQITENQKELARQVFDLYSYYLGVQFTETDGVGTTIATGNEEVFGAITVIGSSFDESFGGDWFQQAMYLIGFQMLDLGQAEDLPEGTIMGGPDGDFLNLPEDTFSADRRLTFGRDAEPVFPGDHDIVHGQHMFFPTADDVDLYQFTLDEPGVVTLETFAQRRSDASRLDTVLRLFDGSKDPILLAQNDDYYGNDSYVNIELGSGTYYVGVSSTGNDQYDPAFPTYTGGRTIGAYDLRVEFRSTADNSIVDTTGQRLDGDSDGQQGGIHNFWFRAETEDRTIYVDKSGPGTGDGSLTSPYTNLQTAVSAANEGDIVRVVGNHVGDEDLLNDRAYEIGISSNGQPLADGGVDGLLRIGKGVTVMVDAGSVFKLRRGAILAGSDSPLLDNSGGAIQILGTPEAPVIFTSYNDESIGVDTNPLITTPARGDWGGVIIRNDVSRAAGQFDYEEQGIFLNYVNHADMRYGGGVLNINSVARAINPVTLIDARPTITNNSITFGMDAALAVSPNSFEETNFRGPRYQTVPFTPDYSRIGPDIHGNFLVNNEVNGLSVVNRGTSFDKSLVMDVSGRFDDRDIVHVISDNLQIASNPGGILFADGMFVSRPSNGRLAIDPGTTVKMDGGVIEVGMGATFLSEGTSDNPVVISSVHDNRFGAGGTFDTDIRSLAATNGDWGGVSLSPTSAASLDFNVIAYGGGEAPIEGTFAGFNAVEIYQADARITNSTFEFNGTGLSNGDTGNRAGRGANEASTIFVRGAQPIIVGNLFQDNDAAAVNINVNALNYYNTLDYGRQTGPANRIDGYLDNQGPLIRDNTLDGNGINGMVVRGGTLTTESVWDDTDMVHVLREGIYVPNFHTFGGLRLKSSQTQSLVVKLDGDAAGFVTTGSSIGIPDHIGGSIQVIGQPGRPVVLTSLFDDSVGAGKDTSGAIQADTNNGGRPLRSVPLGATNGGFEIDVNFGPNINQFPEVMNAVQFAVDIWEEQIQDPIRVVIDVDTALVQFNDADGNPNPSGDGLEGFPGASTLSAPTVFNYDARLFDTTTTPEFVEYDRVQSALIGDAGDHEALIQQLPDFQSIDVTFPTNTAVPFAVADQMRLTSANAKALDLGTTSMVASAYDFEDDAIDGTILINQDLDLFDFDRTNGILTYREDFQSQFMEQIGTILGFDSSLGFVNGFLANPLEPDPANPDLRQEIPLSPLDLFRFAPGDGSVDFADASRLLDPQNDEHVFYAGGDLDYRQWPFEAIAVGDIPIDFDNWQDEYFNRDGELSVFEPIGIMDRASVLRDGLLRTHDSLQSAQGVIIDITEADRLAFDSIGYDIVGPTPGAWEGITMHELTYDGNVEYILEAEAPTPEGADLNATPGTAQSLGTLAPSLESGNETRRLAFEVHGVVDSDADVDVYSFTGVAGTNVWIDVDQTSQTFDAVIELVDFNGNILAGSDDSVFESVGLSNPLGSGRTLGAPDIYSTNVHDAGMQVTLPGPTGFEGEFYVVVRSFDSELADGTPDGLGNSQGRYELQVRLKPTDVVPGTTVQYADIRYAENGIQIYGPPSDSPLLGEQSEDESFNDNFSESIRFSRNDEGFVVPNNSPRNTEYPYEVSAQKLGNLLGSRQGAISVAGNLEGFGDVDWYSFELTSRDFNDLAGTVDVIFDIDYADGLGRPNTALSVWREASFGFGGGGFGSLDFGVGGAELIYYGESSNLPEDQTAMAGALLGGSYSTEDPYIGPVSIPYRIQLDDDDFFSGGFDFGTTYYVAVSPINLVPLEIADESAAIEPIMGDASGNRGFENTSAGETYDDLDAPKPEFVLNPNAPFGNETGPYQLEIRIADPDVGDHNRERLQGQIVIANNFISDSRGFGVSVEDGLRDLPFYGGAIGTDVPRPREILENDLASPRLFGGTIRQQHGQFTTGDYAPHSGVPRALPNQNEERVIPGISIINNVISGGFDGGVQITGDPGGIVLNTYNLSLLFDLFDDTDCGDAENTEFTIWDHQGRTQTFDFVMGGGQSEPGKIPIRYDCSVPETVNPGSNGTAQTVITPPTLTDDLRAEIEHAIRLSDLDIKIQKVVAESGVVTVPTSADDTEDISYEGSATFFIEGAVKVALVDVRAGKDSPFIPGDIDPDLLLPFMTAFIAQQGAVPYARIVNNTLVGRGGSLFDGNGVDDVGIIVEDNASPTILNNIISNFATGIRSDNSANDGAQERFTFLGNDFPIDQSAFGGANIADNDNGIFANGGDGFLGLGAGGLQLSERNIDEDFISVFPVGGSRPTIVASTVYQGNLNDTLRINEGSDRLQLPDSAPLFVDPANGNFFLTETSLAKNSSTAFLNERNYLAEVQTTVGLTPTQIVAPRTDALGILREDGFADRGALERADFVGPTAQLLNPEGSAEDPSLAVVETNLTDFIVQLQDGASQADPVFGSGVDDNTVLLSAVTLIQDGQALVEGEDYILSYNPINDSLGFTPPAGVWPTGSIYTIVLDNQVIMDRSGNNLQANQLDGSTQFTIQTGAGFDFGDAPAPYPTLRIDDGARHGITSLFLGAGVQFDSDGSPLAPDENDDGVTFASALIRGGVFTLSVEASEAGGTLNAWIDFNGNGSWDDAGDQVLTNRQLSAGPNNLSFPVPQNATLGTTWARFRLSSQADLSPTGPAPDGEVEDYQVTVGNNPWTNPDDPFDVNANDVVSPTDALIIINELNDPMVMDPETGALPLTGVIPDGTEPNFFFDVTGDGFVSPLDALLVINQLNENATNGLRVDPTSGGPAPAGADSESAGTDSAFDTTDNAASSLIPPLAGAAGRRGPEARFESPPNRRRLDSGALEVGPLDDVIDEIADDIASAWSTP